MTWSDAAKFYVHEASQLDSRVTVMIINQAGIHQEPKYSRFTANKKELKIINKNNLFLKGLVSEISQSAREDDRSK